MIYTLLANGFEEVEALTVVDILRRAEIDVQTVSIYNSKTVTGGHGIAVTADITLSEMKEGDMVFLPGGMPGVTNLEADKNVIQVLKDYEKNGKYIAAICAAPSILGHLGILKGKKAACYPGFEKDLIGAEVVFDKVVRDRKVLTSRGAGTAAELAFSIVSLLKSKELANTLRSGMIYE